MPWQQGPAAAANAPGPAVNQPFFHLGFLRAGRRWPTRNEPVSKLSENEDSSSNPVFGNLLTLILHCTTFLKWSAVYKIYNTIIMHVCE
jgi:hypothetical protein